MRYPYEEIMKIPQKENAPPANTRPKAPTLDFGLTNSDARLIAARGYKFLKVVGEGSYAKVLLSTLKRADKDEVMLACKVINAKKAPEEYVMKFLPRELEILTKLAHPHIIHIHCIYQRSRKFLVFMRYAERGDLLEYILNNGETPEKLARPWFRQIAHAVEYLHSVNIAHRDIKLENILITSNYNVKLADFGFARFTLDFLGRAVMSETFCGSMAYAPPEILTGRPYSPRQSDVWSLGVVLYIMLNRAMPFNDGSIKSLHRQQVLKLWSFRKKAFKETTQEVRNMVAKLLEPDMKLRPPIQDIVKDKWLHMEEGQVDISAYEKEVLAGKPELQLQHKIRSKKNISNYKREQLVLDSERSARITSRTRQHEQIFEGEGNLLVDGRDSFEDLRPIVEEDLEGSEEFEEPSLIRSTGTLIETITKAKEMSIKSISHPTESGDPPI